jgi:hypothetical protein
MARWKLTEPHYLKVDGTKWEYNEIDRITGRPKRTQFDVPLYLNPNYEDDLKGFGQGDVEVALRIIVVSDGNNAQPKDVIFFGSPTPGMLPLDDEAKEISARFAKVWDAPAEDGPSYAQRLEERFIDQMGKLQTAAQAAPQPEGQASLMESMAAMMEQQTEILAQLAKGQVEQSRRKVA